MTYSIKQTQEDLLNDENPELLFIELQKILDVYCTPEQIEIIKKAYVFSEKSHQGQKRKSGELFIVHPLNVALILAEMRLDYIAVTAALLHDVVEDTDIDLKEIRKNFGKEVKEIIDGLTKLEMIEEVSAEQEQAENLRKMILAMSKDIRVILIKLADRMHNLKTMHHLTRQKQLKKAQETLDVYAPLAHRLGIFQLKWQLEDLSFQLMNPGMFEEIQRMVAEKRDERDGYLSSAMRELKSALNQVSLESEISGRTKHFYSIYRKMVDRDKEFAEIYDLSAIRMVAKSVQDCYAILGIIHSLWTPVPGRFKDYIAMPKFNGYKSLHTTVIGPLGRPLEIQIRTEEMHRIAEYGVAAHWLYKEKGQERVTEFSWLNGIVEWQSELKDPQEFMESLRIDLFSDEVFVFTPKGRVISQPWGATPIDFAYAIHTEVGNTCVGAKVNDRIVPFEYQLQPGDIVEIITAKNTNPKRDWLMFVKTGRAKSKIRQWFSRHNREDFVQQGKEAIAENIRRQKISLTPSELNDLLKEISKQLNFKSVEDFYANIGAGKTSPHQVISKIISLLNKKSALSEETIFDTVLEIPLKTGNKSGVRVKGVDDVMVRVARCCSPVPGDPILGFITKGRGISVHRVDCPNADYLSLSSERKIDVAWDARGAGAFQTEIEVEALDRRRLLKDISGVLADANLNILAAKGSAGKNRVAKFRFVIEIGDLDQLQAILSIIKKIDCVIDVYRVLPGFKADEEL